MASTFTSNLAIEKPAIGEQDNTWGTTLQENWDIFDRTISQVGSIALTGTTKTLTTSTAGVISEGHYPVINFTGTPGGTCTVTISPNSIQRIYTILNSTDQTVTMTQGSGGDVSIVAGDTKIIYCDGAGSGAEVVDITANLQLGAVNIDGGSIDNTPVGANTASTGNFSTLSIGGTAITATAAELNKMDGVTSTTAELNILDGVTADAAELNKMDGMTATTAELNVLDGIPGTLTAQELGYVDGVTSAIQTQLDAKPDLTGSDTITATWSMNGTLQGSGTFNFSSGTLTLADNQIAGAKVAAATTSAEGVVELATTAEGDTGTATDKIPAVDVVKSMIDTHAPTQLAEMKSFGHFGYSGSVVIGASGNVDSIVRTGTGVFDVTFTTAVSDANYVVNANIGSTSNAFCEIRSITTTGFTIHCLTRGSSSIDPSDCMFTVWR